MFYVYVKLLKLYIDVVSTPPHCVVTSEMVLFSEKSFLHAINHDEIT